MYTQFCTGWKTDSTHQIPKVFEKAWGKSLIEFSTKIYYSSLPGKNMTTVQ